MNAGQRFVVGTSGYSFADWVGAFYPAGTQRGGMFAYYQQVFSAVELNFTFYRVPTAGTIGRLAEACGEGFRFWVKASRKITHERDTSVLRPFLAALEPMSAAGKLGGLLLQFPQSFHRTVDNRNYLGSILAQLESIPAAVEFRHYSWEHPATLDGLRERSVALVIPDVPDIRSLYHSQPVLTSAIGYLRLHSRDAGKWYGEGGTDRYDYRYSERELSDLAAEWVPLAEQSEKVYAFFNNCHRGQAAENAEAFRRILEKL